MQVLKRSSSVFSNTGDGLRQTARLTTLNLGCGHKRGWSLDGPSFLRARQLRQLSDQQDLCNHNDQEGEEHKESNERLIEISLSLQRQRSTQHNAEAANANERDRSQECSYGDRL